VIFCFFTGCITAIELPLCHSLVHQNIIQHYAHNIIFVQYG